MSNQTRSAVRVQRTARPAAPQVNTDLNVVLDPKAFVADIAQAPELYSQIPALFERQAEAGLPCFVIQGSQIKQDNHLRIALEAPVITGQHRGQATEISCRFKLRGILDADGEFVPMDASNRNGGLPDNAEWLNSFRSNDVTISREDFSAPAWNAIVKHAELYQEIGEDAYYNDKASERIYLDPTQADTQFVFLLQVRTSPRNGELSIGLVNVMFAPGSFGILGKGVAPVNRATAGFTPVRMPEPARAAAPAYAGVDEYDEELPSF